MILLFEIEEQSLIKIAVVKMARQIAEFLQIHSHSLHYQAIDLSSADYNIIIIRHHNNRLLNNTLAQESYNNCQIKLKVMMVIRRL